MGHRWVSLREASRMTGRAEDELRFRIIMGEEIGEPSEDLESYVVRVEDEARPDEEWPIDPTVVFCLLGFAFLWACLLMMDALLSQFPGQS